MTRDLRQERKLSRMSRMEQKCVNENNEFDSVSTGSSVYTMAAVAGCIIFCIGIVIYALIGA